MMKPVGGLGEAIESTRVVLDMMRPFGGNLEAIEATRGIDKAILKEARLLGRDPYRGILGARNILEESRISRSVGVATLNDIFRSVGGIHETYPFLEPFKAVRDNVSSAFGPSLADRWDHFSAASVLPTLKALSVETFDRPTALLSQFTADPTLGSLSWLEQSDDEGMSLRVAAFQSESESESEAAQGLTAIPEVICLCCDSPLPIADSVLTSNGKIVGPLRVLPCCFECLRRDAEDPGYIVRCMEKWRDRPRFLLQGVPGTGLSDGRPAAKGVLRLIRNHNEDDED